MTDPKVPETPALIPQARSDKFTTVTNAGNKCVAALREVDPDDTLAMVDVIKKVMPDLLQTVVSVTFEKAKIWQVLESNPNLSYYTNLDYDSWVNPGDMNKSDMEKAKVNFLKNQKRQFYWRHKKFFRPKVHWKNS